MVPEEKVNSAMELARIYSRRNSGCIWSSSGCRNRRTPTTGDGDGNCVGLNAFREHRHLMRTRYYRVRMFSHVREGVFSLP